MHPRIRTILLVSSLISLFRPLPALSADPSLQMKVTPNGYLDARGVSVMLYDSAFSPIFFDQKDAGMQIILHGNRIATNGSLRLLATPEQWDALNEEARRDLLWAARISFFLGWRSPGTTIPCYSPKKTWLLEDPGR